MSAVIEHEVGPFEPALGQVCRRCGKVLTYPDAEVSSSDGRQLGWPAGKVYQQGRMTFTAAVFEANLEPMVAVECSEVQA